MLAHRGVRCCGHFLRRRSLSADSLPSRELRERAEPHHVQEAIGSNQERWPTSGAVTSCSWSACSSSRPPCGGEALIATTSHAVAIGPPCASSWPGMSPKEEANETDALIQRYRVALEQRKLAPSTINQHLSAIRALADECAESGLLDQPTAAAIGRVKGVPIRGVRLGKWLTREQAEHLLSAPPETLMGLRDRAILGLLIGCGLRRDELANLTFLICSSARGAGSSSISSARDAVCAPCRCRAGPRRSSTTGLAPRI